jgi:hypothetical protein
VARGFVMPVLSGCRRERDCGCHLHEDRGARSLPDRGGAAEDAARYAFAKGQPPHGQAATFRQWPRAARESAPRFALNAAKARPASHSTGGIGGTHARRRFEVHGVTVRTRSSRMDGYVTHSAVQSTTKECNSGTLVPRRSRDPRASFRVREVVSAATLANIRGRAPRIARHSAHTTCAPRCGPAVGCACAAAQRFL